MIFILNMVIFREFICLLARRLDVALEEE